MQIAFFFHLVVYFIQDIKVCSVVCVLELGKFDESNLEEGIQAYLLVEVSLFSQNKDDWANPSGHCFAEEGVIASLFRIPLTSHHMAFNQRIPIDFDSRTEYGLKHRSKF